METVIDIRMLYPEDEISMIIDDYTPHVRWSEETKRNIVNDIRRYFNANKKQVVAELDKTICEIIKSALIETSYLTKEESENDE